MIFTTAYTSRMKPLPDHDLSDLLERSRTRNAERGITGLLMYRDGRVLQMLEGPEAAVRDLYDRISSDVRHDNVTNVWTSTSQRRRFPDWSMGFDDLQRRDDDTPDAFASRGGAASSQDVSSRDVSSRGGLRMTLRPDTTTSAQDAAAQGGSETGLFDHDLSIVYVQRREQVLRRALTTGDRMISALAIILNGHDAEDVPGEEGVEPHLRCRVCAPSGDAVLDAYPCATAKNAIWALEATGVR